MYTMVVCVRISTRESTGEKAAAKQLITDYSLAVSESALSSPHCAKLPRHFLLASEQ